MANVLRFCFWGCHGGGFTCTRCSLMFLAILDFVTLAILRSRLHNYGEASIGFVLVPLKPAPGEKNLL